MWKLHQIDDEGVYKDLRYDRIRFLEQVRGEPALTPYPDPGKDHRADIGIAFRILGTPYPIYSSDGESSKVSPAFPMICDVG